jgi:hypothetical protein
MPDTAFSPADLIHVFGDQAYHAGARLVVEALVEKDLDSARVLAESLRNLIRRGYDKKPKRADLATVIAGSITERPV